MNQFIIFGGYDNCAVCVSKSIPGPFNYKYVAIYPSVDSATSYLQCNRYCQHYYETVMLHLVQAQVTISDTWLEICNCYLGHKKLDAISYKN